MRDLSERCKTGTPDPRDQPEDWQSVVRTQSLEGNGWGHAARLQVEWLRRTLGPEDSRALRTLEWVGVAAADLGSPLESILRYKCLVLVAVTLKRRSMRSAPPRSWQPFSTPL